MKISLKWLQDYLELPVSAEELERVLPMIGHEVEEVEVAGLPPIDRLVVGEVLEREQHPDADKLGVCKVDVGAGEPLQIVCGASNYKVGDRVPVAKVGAVLPGGFEIKEAKLRGVPSSGMMCSAKELGLGQDHSGLMILTNRPEVGKPVNELFDTDFVLNLELTANRGDCASHYGVARELAAYYNKPLKKPEPTCAASLQSSVPEDFLLKDVRIETENCALYTAWSVRGVTIAPSPKWLQERLEAVGLRPINNVVDVTNYILMAYGQPLHAFDAKKIGGEKIIVRQANEGESITTLDEQKRGLDPSMMVIADAQKPLVVAGIMGSVDAEVDNATTDIVLESAWFKPGNIRATARKLALHTDSSYRFARDVDPAGVEWTARLALDMILELAGGTLAPVAVKVGAAPRGENQIELTPDFVRQRSGIDASDEAIADIFSRLGFDVNKGSNPWQVTVPSLRGEVCRPIDLVEEFVRIYGTDKIPSVPLRAVGLDRRDDALAVLDSKLARDLTHQRFFECTHYTLREGKEIARWFPQQNAEELGLLNPLTSEQSHLRPSLLPGLLEALRLNRHRGNEAPRLFETGRVFQSAKDGVHELYSVAFVLEAEKREHWHPRALPDFFTAKGILENLATQAGISAKNLKWSASEGGPLWQGQHSAYVGDWAQRGWRLGCGFVSVEMLKAWDIDGLVLAGELLLTMDYIARPKKQARIEPLAEFPASRRDLALVVKKEIPAESVQGDLEKIARKATGKGMAVEAVEVFDVYAGKGLAEDSKSLAFKMVFRAADRTLKDKEVANVFDQVQAGMKKKGYEIRG